MLSYTASGPGVARRRTNGGEMNVNAGRFLTKRAMLNPGTVGLVAEGKRYTFHELNKRANRMAHVTDGLGVRPGDRVCVVALNGVEHYDLFFGLGKNGGILVPVNHRLSSAELRDVIEDAGPRVVVYGPEFDGLIDSIRDEVPPFRAVRIGEGRGKDPSYEDLMSRAKDFEPMVEGGNDDELVIIYTGWVAGKPRGVMLTHENFLWASITMSATLNRLGPSFLLPLPFFHIGALGWLPFFMHRGISCVLPRKFNPHRFVELVNEEGVNSFGVVPTMLFFIKETGIFKEKGMDRVENILSYGSATPSDLIREYAGHGIRVRQLYGLTESSGPVLVIDGEYALEKMGSCGLPFFHTEVRLVDDNGLDVPVNQVGEVIIRAGHVMKGYWDKPEATADAVRDGWLYTGDLARTDSDGFFYIVDRKKQLIITGGENVSPSEIEAAIVEHPEVVDAAVVGKPDPIWGERAEAYVMKKPGSGLTEEEVINWCAQRIARYKRPRKVEFVREIPRTLTGKLEKRRIKPEREKEGD